MTEKEIKLKISDYEDEAERELERCGWNEDVRVLFARIDELEELLLTKRDSGV